MTLLEDYVTGAGFELSKAHTIPSAPLSLGLLLVGQMHMLSATDPALCLAAMALVLMVMDSNKLFLQ